MKRLFIWLSWKNYMEYHVDQLAHILSPHYDVTASYLAPEPYWDDYDLVLPLHYVPGRNPTCDPAKIIKIVWAFHERGWPGKALTVLAPSTPIYDRVLPYCTDRLHLLPWGINPVDFPARPLPDTPLTIGWAGCHKNPYKQFPKLEQALSDLNFQPAKAHYVSGRMVGDWEVPAIANYYAGIHVYVCSSFFEGFCFPLLEAAAVGRAIISFDVGIARDLQNSGAGVVIVDTFDEMRNAILTCDLKTLGQMSADAIAAHWTWEVLTPRWLEVLDAIP